MEANGVELNVALAGHGPALLLLHGFPHTWQVWSEVLAPLAAHHLVIAPDMRGFGASERAAHGYDANTLAEDARALLGSLGLSSAAVVALDAGVPPALSLALRHPQLVDRLVLMESLAGTLPGAEDFLTDGPRGGSASTRCLDWPSQYWKATRRAMWASSLTPARWERAYRLPYVMPSSPPTPATTRCVAHSRTTARCR
ncbi:alpha/beta fold hydrolase [Streptomyces aureus]